MKVTNTGADIAWDANLTTRQYKVNYRLTGATEWTTDITTLPTYSFKQLTDNSTYECTVTALCSSEESEPSEVLQFKTNRTVNYACGTGEGKFDLSNTQPLASLSRFEEFKAADFIVEANEVTGSDGTFSGTGYVLVPYLSFMKMMVTFKNITINSDHRMISGQIEFVYDVATGMVGTIYRDKTTTAGATEQFLAEGGNKVITTTQPITNVMVKDSTVTITLQDGTTQTVTADKKGDTVAIVSSDGITAYVADTGSGMVFTTPVPGSSEASNSSSVATPAQSGIYGCSVDIKPIVDPSGGFDPVGNGINKPNNYFLSSKAGKPIAWKSIPAGGTDYVQVEVKGDCAIDSLRYLRASGLPVPSTPSGRGKRLLLTGTSDGDEEVLTVALSTKKLQPDSTYSQTLTEAGALGLVSYEPLQRDVYIVPVNGAVTPAYAPAIKAVLDKLYAPAQVSWNVTIKANIQVDNITADGFKTADLALGSRYTSDMNTVIKAWKKANNLPAKTVVLFFVKANNSDKLGYMPLTGNYGFIFNLGSNLELLAHELAHGTFNLKHTFSDDAYWRESGKAPIFAEKTTQNLMDYANGTELWKYQWDLIHDPESVVFASLDEDEGAYGNYYNLQKVEAYALQKGIDLKYSRIKGSQRVIVDYEHRLPSDILTFESELIVSKNILLNYAIVENNELKAYNFSQEKQVQMSNKFESIDMIKEYVNSSEFNASKKTTTLLLDDFARDFLISVKQEAELRKKAVIVAPLKYINNEVEPIRYFSYDNINKLANYDFDGLYKEVEKTVKEGLSDYTKNSNEKSLISSILIYGQIEYYLRYMRCIYLKDYDLDSDVRTEFSNKLELAEQRNKSYKAYNINQYNELKKREWEKKIQDFKNAIETAQEIKEIYNRGYTAVVIDVVSATGGVVFSTVALVAPEPTTLTKIEAAIGYAWSAEKYIGAVRKFNALQNGFFDDNKEYKVIGGLIKDNFGEAGYLIYNVADILTSGRGAQVGFKEAEALRKLNGKISGKALNKYIESVFNTSDGVYTLIDYINGQIK